MLRGKNISNQLILLIIRLIFGVGSSLDDGITRMNRDRFEVQIFVDVATINQAEGSFAERIPFDRAFDTTLEKRGLDL